MFHSRWGGLVPPFHRVPYSSGWMNIWINYGSWMSKWQIPSGKPLHTLLHNNGINRHYWWENSRTFDSAIYSSKLFVIPNISIHLPVFSSIFPWAHPILNHSKPSTFNWNQPPLGLPSGNDVNYSSLRTWSHGPVKINLVGGLEYVLFSHILGIIIPTDELIFFREIGTTNQK